MSEDKTWNIEKQEELGNEEQRHERIENERLRLWGLLDELEVEILNTMHPLVDNLAFLRVQIEDLQAHILKYGTKEKYQNGKHQWGMKESSEFKALNAFIQRYTQVNSQLMSLIPKKEAEVQQEVSDGFEEALSKRPR